MNQFITRGIVLSRTDYGEADRIIKFLTPDHGKISAMAKGVRKSKSKLAGSIELFSVSDLTFIKGRSDIDTLISSRLVVHYDRIVKDIERTNVGYELIKLTNKVTEDNPEPAYFNLLKTGFEALDDEQIEPQITSLWFNMQLIKQAGHQPNLYTDKEGNKLTEASKYTFDLDKMQFNYDKSGRGISANHVKFLRLGFSSANPNVINRVEDAKKLTAEMAPLVLGMLQNNIRN